MAVVLIPACFNCHPLSVGHVLCTDMCHDLLEVCHFDMLTSFHYSDSYSAGMAMQQGISLVRTAEQA